MPISDQLRRVIKDSGVSISELARNSGVPQPMISRFLAGRDIVSKTMDRLAEHFGLELVPRGQRGEISSQRKKQRAKKPAKKVARKVAAKRAKKPVRKATNTGEKAATKR